MVQYAWKMRTAYRALRRRPGYTALNVGGLAVGIAAFLVGLLFVLDELSYDRFYERAGELYRLHYASDDAETAAVGWRAGEELAGLYGERVGVARLRQWDTPMTVRHGDRAFLEEGLLMADPSVFDVLEVELVQGDPASALVAPSSIVLAEPIAAKYFGEEDPVGELLFVNGRPHTVTGVMAERPANSHLRFDLLVTMHPEGVWRNDTAWRFNAYYTYVRVPDPALVAEVERTLTAQMREAVEGATFALMPIVDVHLYGPPGQALRPGGSPGYLALLAIIALAVLAIACVNFVNLATARAAERAKEVGVRKALGALRPQLFSQFIGEAVLVTALSAALALGLAVLALPAFNELAGKELTLHASDLWWLGPILLSLVVGVGFAAGSYPALVLSSFAPARVLKGSGGRPSGGGFRGAPLRRSLIVFQFAVSTFLLIGTLTVAGQLRHVQQFDRGVDSEQVLVVEVGDGDRAMADYRRLREELARQPLVEAVTATVTVPGWEPGFVSFRPGGYAPGDSLFRTRRLVAGIGFAETYGVEVVRGRDLAWAMETATEEAYLINETAAERLAALLGWEDPIGKWLRLWGMEGQIVGVVEDFHFAPLHKPVEPLVIDLANSFNFISIRLHARETSRALAQVQEAWERALPGEPFRYSFLDQDFEQVYSAEVKLGRTFGWFSGLALLISCLGLLGLAAYMTEQRGKEVAVRKVLGASVADVVVLLTGDVVRLVLVAVALAVPLGYLAMRSWLEGFAYRIGLDPWIFLGAGGLALLIAVLTVGYHATKAALADPVKRLRYE